MTEANTEKLYSTSTGDYGGGGYLQEDSNTV